MVTLGVKSSGQKVTPLHTSTFDIDERALLIGARLLTRVLLEWPGPQESRVVGSGAHIAAGERVN